MTEINLSSISGLTPPYTVYACDVFGVSCTLIATISGVVPPINSILLPPPFYYAPAVGIKIVAAGCTKFKVFYCSDDNKDFQDLDDFLFMDSDPYFFMD